MLLSLTKLLCVLLRLTKLLCVLKHNSFLLHCLQAAIVLLLDGLWFGYDVANFWIHKN